MINPPAMVTGQALTVDVVNRLSSSIRAIRVIEGTGIKVERSPCGTRVSLRHAGQTAHGPAAMRLPAPWDALIRQASEKASAGITFLRRWASLGGVFCDIPLDLAPGSFDSYTAFPASSADADWIVAARIMITAEPDGHRSIGAAIVFYADDSEGRQALADAGQTLLDSYMLPLYIVHYTADAGTWSITTDLRQAPSLVVYT